MNILNRGKYKDYTYEPKYFRMKRKYGKRLSIISSLDISSVNSIVAVMRPSGTQLPLFDFAKLPVQINAMNFHAVCLADKSMNMDSYQFRKTQL